MKRKCIYVTAMVCTILGIVKCQVDDSVYVVDVNEKDVIAKAREIACKKNDCEQIHCPSKRGWNLLGSDLGCCSHYQGCCEFASLFCWVHDVMCRCCDYGFLICGPYCKEDTDCVDRMMGDGSGEPIT
ncbi:uncharacterized protein LOC121377279 isoform X2 [Gigantopelta aegis]|nr:uncharacterized protein LOC121377279 isoform X2 [Gigantopelta aegis]XP_041361149.1 uncharacterized protein LOC121377279 isoform X2 [Gigantopelta aegis]